MTKIRIVFENVDVKAHDALGSYIGMVDVVVHDLKNVLDSIEDNVDYAKKDLIRMYNYLKRRNIEIQTDMGLNPLNETRYSQFKRSATTRQPSEAVHKAVREIYNKVKDLKKVIEYASRIKTEMNQGSKYKKRTSEALQKLSLELKDISNTLKREWKPR
jgi:DNA-directed RNA polymerase subunit L